MIEWTQVFGDELVILDGGLSTQVQRRGADISGSLWTARALIEDPSFIEQAHRDFIDAGAEVIITASYQVSRQGFMAAGLSGDDADRALFGATRAARAAAGATGVLVASSVGPYGAVLHDGSEYRGNYGLSEDELTAFHVERLEVLVASEPDLLAVETIPDVVEARALRAALAGYPDVPAWMCFTCRDERQLCAGQSIEDAVRIAESIPSVIGVGVNCTEPKFVEDILLRMTAVTDLPVIAYPNAGGVWNAVSGEWEGDDLMPSGLASKWRRAGANALGGCCGTDSDYIRSLVAACR